MAEQLTQAQVAALKKRMWPEEIFRLIADWERLRAESEQIADDPSPQAWKDFVGYAYRTVDGPKTINEITTHYLSMRRQRDTAEQMYAALRSIAGELVGALKMFPRSRDCHMGDPYSLSEYLGYVENWIDSQVKPAIARAAEMGVK